MCKPQRLGWRLENVYIQKSNFFQELPALGVYSVLSRHISLIFLVVKSQRRGEGRRWEKEKKEGAEVFKGILHSYVGWETYSMETTTTFSFHAM